LRRANCLAPLVAARHAIATGDDGHDDRQHGAAFPGRQKLVPATRLLSDGQSPRLSDYADSCDTNPHRYFKNGLGGLVWNRPRYMKDSETGKRNSRINPECEWVIHDVHDLRIVSDDLLAIGEKAPTEC
jgi:hypothetical protein